MQAGFRVTAAMAVAFIMVLAGCVDQPVEGDDGEGPPQGSEQELLARLAAIPEPDFDRVAAVDWWQSFVETYVKRDNGLPNNEPAAQHIADEMTAAGYDVRILEYTPPMDPASLRPVADPVRVIEAIKPGTQNPDRRIGLISHYDTQTNTIQGAYDDGSGVAVEVSLCKMLAQVPTNNTIACLFFDAEERGLVGSDLYVQDVIVEGDEPFTYQQAFGYDMVGLNWPGYTDWKLYAMAGLDTDALAGHMLDHLDFLNVTLFGFLGEKYNVTTDGVEILDVHDRNSDERQFKEAGVPIVRFAGGRNAADYPEYHMPQDTADYVYEFAGGRENFEKGYEMVVLVSWYTILAYDQYDPLAMPAF